MTDRDRNEEMLPEGYVPPSRSDEASGSDDESTKRGYVPPKLTMPENKSPKEEDA